MQTKYRLITLALLSSLALTGCQTFNSLFRSDSPTGGTLYDDIPSLETASAGSSTSQAGPKKSRPSLVIYVSSSSPVQGYTLVEQNNHKIYVDPRQTLLRSDLNNVTAVQDSSGRAFLKLEFNEQGKQKLTAITSRNTGKSLTVTYRNSLLSILNITQANTSGVLNVPMNSASDANTVEQRILDGD